MEKQERHYRDGERELLQQAVQAVNERRYRDVWALRQQWLSRYGAGRGRDA